MSEDKLAGRYRIDERLAVGGMGAVYLATDERLDRRVAVKLLKDEHSNDPRFIERFKREARSAGALSHPNIATVFDYGEDEGRQFIVMEYVEGRDLARVLREDGALDAERAAIIVAQVCEALDHAHSAGVIHRDVKPANIIIGNGDWVKVTDFGIARASGDSTLTATGAVLGTANYISPEHASGGKITPASDIYSLGVVLYETVTGSLPFTGDSPIAVAMRHISDDLPPPSKLKPRLPREIDDIVGRATAKGAAGRFASAAEMAAALRAMHDPTAPIGAGSTAVLGAGTTAQMEHSVWPIPGTRWDAQRVGKTVLAVFVILLLVAAGLTLARIAGPADETARRTRGAGGNRTQSAQETPTPTPSETQILMPNVIGYNVKDAEDVLKAMGFDVEKEDVVADAEKDEVVDTDPDPDAPLFEGQTITLYVSEGPEDDEHLPPGLDKKEEKEEDD